MTERRNDETPEPERRRGGPREQRDPGAYIGRLPERATETIPGGLGRRDKRVSAVGTQPGPTRGPAPAAQEGQVPEGHREAGTATDDTAREAGQDR